MILVDVNKISYDPSSRGYLVVLKSLENNDFLQPKPVHLILPFLSNKNKGLICKIDATIIA